MGNKEKNHQGGEGWKRGLRFRDEGEKVILFYVGESLQFTKNTSEKGKTT